MAKTKGLIAILWRKQSILLRFHGDFSAKKIVFFLRLCGDKTTYQ